MRKLLLLAAGLSLPLPSIGGGAGSLDGFYVPNASYEVSDPDSGSGKTKGSGFGIRGLAPLSDSLLLTGEYQSTSYDDLSEDILQTRLGIGLTGETPSGLYIEYIRDDLFGNKANGYGVHARFESNESPSRIYAQLGYVNLSADSEHLSGFEYLVGLTFPVFGSASGFVDYRKTNLNGADSDIEIDIADLRAGVRFSF